MLVPLFAGKVPPGFGPVVRLLHQASRWSMVEVLTVAGLLSLVRLAALADATPGPAMFALGMLTLLFAAIEQAGIAASLVVRAMSSATMLPQAQPRGRRLGSTRPFSDAKAAVWSSHVDPGRRLRPQARFALQRAAIIVLRHEKPQAVQRTWACVLAAAVLYIPANALPVMTTTSAFATTSHTLLGGIHELWIDGAWGLAAIVFVASIAVPVLKIAALGLLAWSVRKRAALAKDRTRPAVSA